MASFKGIVERREEHERKELPVPESLLMADEDAQVRDEKVGQIQKQQQQTPFVCHFCLNGLRKDFLPSPRTPSCTRVPHIHAAWRIKHTQQSILMCVCVSIVLPSPAWAGLATEGLQGCRPDKKGGEADVGEGQQ